MRPCCDQMFAVFLSSDKHLQMSEDAGDSIIFCLWIANLRWSMMILHVWLLDVATCCYNFKSAESDVSKKHLPGKPSLAWRELQRRNPLRLVADPHGFPIFSDKNFHDFYYWICCDVLLIQILLSGARVWEGYVIAIHPAIQHIPSLVGIWDLWRDLRLFHRFRIPSLWGVTRAA